MSESLASGILPAARPLELLTEAADRRGRARRGGWFERAGRSPAEIGVVGCTAGGSALFATRNSIYALTAREDGRFEARGGWFERAGKSPAEIGVVGCTAGGSALFTRIVAAPGLFLEFDDGTRTTRIQRVRVLREPAPS